MKRTGQVIAFVWIVINIWMLIMIVRSVIIVVPDVMDRWQIIALNASQISSS